MGSQKVVEHVEKGQDTLSIIAHLACADIVDNHVTDLLLAMILIRQILGKRGRGNFGYMLVLGDGKNLFLGDTTKSQAVL